MPYEYIQKLTYNGYGQILSIDGPLPGTSDTTAFSYDSAAWDLLSVAKPLIGSTFFNDYDDAGWGR